MWQQLAPYLPVVIAAGFIVWRQSSAHGRPLRLPFLWIAPVLVILGLGFLLAAAPPPLSPITLGGFPLALAIGGGLGYLMARHMNLIIDPKTGIVSAKASPVGILLLLGLLVARTALRSATGGTQVDGHHLDPAVLVWTELGLLFSAGYVWGRVLTLTLRVRPLVAAHNESKTAS